MIGLLKEDLLCIYYYNYTCHTHWKKVKQKTVKFVVTEDLAKNEKEVNRFVKLG